jgi:hypothetical protein
VCVWIASLSGLRGSVRQKACGSEGRVFGGVWPWQGQGAGPRIGDPTACRATASQAYGEGLASALAVLLVNCGVEKPSMSRGSEC